MNTTQPSPRIDAYKPLEKVHEDIYHSIVDYLKQYIEQGKLSDIDYNNAITKAANYMYLTYENVMLNITRDIDYGQVKRFVRNNTDLVNYFMKNRLEDIQEKEFPFSALVSWLKYDTDILTCAMHSGTNRYNKHTYH